MSASGLGLGVYTTREAARLVGLRPERVARWIQGYHFKGRSGQPSASRPIFEPDLERSEDGTWPLSFQDLIEILFVKAFLNEGVSMPTIRKAAQEGVKLFGVKHPFCVQRFETDGRRIFATLTKTSDSNERLFNIVNHQGAFLSVIKPLLRQIKFDVASGAASMWWPMGSDAAVVLDPRRSFGSPILDSSGIQTRVLAGPVLAGDSPELVAKLFHVTVPEVSIAVDFERHLAKAA